MKRLNRGSEVTSLKSHGTTYEETDLDMDMGCLFDLILLHDYTPEVSYQPRPKIVFESYNCFCFIV